MRRLAVILAALAALTLAAAQQGGAAMVGCFGAPADYVAAFDTVRGQSKNGSVDYPEDRWYDEQQNWSTPLGEPPGHHSQHVHVGRCIPNGKAWPSTSRFMDVGYVAHNMADYRVTSAGQGFNYPPGANAQTTRSGYGADAGQLAEIQAAFEASAGGQPQKVFQSYPVVNPSVNGWKEARAGISMVADGPGAIFLTWVLDSRWYVNDQVAGLPSYPPPAATNQVSVRNRAHVFFRNWDGRIIDDYHHSGWCGMSPPTSFGATLEAGSVRFTRFNLSPPWSRNVDRTVCLYVTDGGGPAALMIDPDFHHHYPAPTAACPNVDAHGNCLGKWVWEPPNPRKEIFSPPGIGIQYPVTIPKAALATLANGLHKLVFLSTDQADCARQGRPCSPGTRGSWTTVSVLPFRVT